MTRTAFLALVLAVSGCSTTRSTMTKGTSSMNPDSSIDSLMKNYQGEVPGASVLVMKDGAVVISKSYGLADLQQRIAVTPATNFRLASVTKQFTASAIMILEERGLLEYDDRIARFLPSLPAATTEITVRHLLTHTSGLVDYEDLMPDGATEQIHDDDVLRLLEKEDRTLFAPGSSYQYSNSGYALLALIVERVSARTFANFLGDEIFKPLQMTGSVAFEDGVSTISTRGFGHTFRDGAFERTDQSSTSAVLGDGGIYSSINDLAKWEAGLTSGRVISPDSLRLAWTPATKTDQPTIDYGFGWRISEHRGTRMLWHSGETRGFRNVMMRFPEKQLMVAVLTNRNDPAPYSTALQIADLYLVTGH